MMHNPATQPSDEFNDFTRAAYQFIRGKHGWGDYWVKLRNGDLVRPSFYEVSEDMVGFEEEHFFVANSNNFGYRWNLDGTSLKNANFDMMEFTKNEL